MSPSARRRTIGLLLATTVAVALAAGCGDTDPGVSVRRANSVDTIALPEPEETTPPPSSIVENPDDATIDFGDGKQPQPYDDFLQASVADIQAYWRETYPQLYGSEFEELGGGIWASYPERDGLPDGCTSNDPNEAYVGQGNAFYCGNGDYMVYDDAELIPSITELYGDSAVGIVFAHEFGHAIQARTEAIPSEPVVLREQQADCFAGSWTAHVARGESDTLTFGDADVKAGLLAMVLVKDGVLGIDVFEGGAHGTAFDRVGAFEHGFIGGAAACKDMETNPLPLLNLRFSNQDEVDSGGNLPYDAIADAVITDLTRFWTATFEASDLTFSAPVVSHYAHDGPFPSCAGVDESQYPFNALYCADTNELFYDEDYARTLYNNFGDFSVGWILSNAWSDGVQTQLGSSLSGEPRVLINDCLTGAWTRDTIPPADGVLEDQLYISPGDLDEAVSTALIVGDEGFANNVVGSAFEKIDNFRAGVLGGLAECNRRITG